MAKMIPSRCSDSTKSPAEKRLFKLLANLPYDWTVIHDFKYIKTNTKRSLNLECDFTIFAPFKGILALEVKGGGVAYNVDSGWSSVDRNGRCHLLERSPFEQAEGNKYDIIDMVRNYPAYKEIKKHIGYAVIFPDMSAIPSLLPREVNRQILLTADDLNKLEVRLKQVFKFWMAEDCKFFDSGMIKNLINYLLPDTVLKINRKIIADCIEEQIILATKRQQEVIKGLRENEVVFVNGVAGSGKTLIAISEARYLCGNNLKVLYLCYNSMLARNLFMEYKGMENLFIYNYHSFVYSITKENAPICPIENETEGDDIIERLNEYIGYYDCIIIDEAQDFRPQWLQNILMIYEKRKDSKLWLFYDNFQDIYHGQGISILEKELQPFKFKLGTNCRNTPEIGSYALQTYNLKGNKISMDFLIESGFQVINRIFTSAKDQQNYLKKEIGRLLKEGFKPTDIVLLSQKKWENTTLFTLGPCSPIRISNDYLNRRENEVAFCTIHSFKGLESRVVFIIDVDAKRFIEEMQYIGATRAKQLLYIIIFQDYQTERQLISEECEDFTF